MVCVIGYHHRPRASLVSQEERHHHLGLILSVSHATLPGGRRGISKLMVLHPKLGFTVVVGLPMLSLSSESWWVRAQD